MLEAEKQLEVCGVRKNEQPCLKSLQQKQCLQGKTRSTVTDVYPFLALNQIRQTGGEGQDPEGPEGVYGERDGASTDGAEGNKKRVAKISSVHNFTQGHFWSHCEFNIEPVLFHNEYLAKPLKSVSEYLKIIHWRGRLLAFNNATVQRCSFLVLFMALDLSMEFSLSSVKISK